jgi:microsomal dipeptidase-like Zn-dependent dipeptidase
LDLATAVLHVGGVAQGFDEDDIRGILGLNWLGAARQVWK